jgi:hypothetical protein
MESDNYFITEKGWKIAMDIWKRFAMDGEDIDDLGAEYGMSREEIEVFMALVFSGGTTFGD